MVQKAFHLDLNRCIGCRACSVACKAENNTQLDVNFRWVADVEGGVFANSSNPPLRYFVSTACNHCADPACMAACPVDAIVKRDDGIVYIDNDICTGCKRCMWACPYGAPQWNATTEKVEKCHLCMHRVDAGLNPACVDTCVGKALSWGDLDEVGGRPGAVSQIPGMPNAGMTNPSTRYKNIG
jgi:anaerobic dimethyl sulfoxide reductase subunit B (iron-sulfur subunit)